MPVLIQPVRLRVRFHDVHLACKNRQADDHGDCDNRQVDPEKVETRNDNVLLGQNVTPQHAGQRSTEGHAEGTVVNANSHAIDRRPEVPIADIGNTVFSLMDDTPGLDYAA